jgi:hypothetical protein
MINLKEYIKEELNLKYFVANQVVELTSLRLERMLSDVYRLGQQSHQSNEKHYPPGPVPIKGTGEPPGKNATGTSEG